jgi:phenylacetate-coenzyme A ligase PaaK-like adenylate-forming protein
VIGRRDDMLVVRGVNLYPSEVEAVLLADPRVAPHYQLVVDRRGPRTDVLVCCEAAGDPDAITADLDAALAARLGLHLDVRVLAGGAVPRQEVGKAVRVVSWDDGAPPLPGL